MHRWISLTLSITIGFSQGPVKAPGSRPESTAPRHIDPILSPITSPQPLPSTVVSSGNPLSKPTGQRITLTRTDGGSVVTSLNRNFAVNQGSSLVRRRFTLNDAACPVQLTSMGIFTAYTSERFTGSYSFQSVGSARVELSIRAVTIIFVLFDIWGKRMHNLRLQHISDLSSGQDVAVRDSKWHATESDVGELFTTLAFVDRVMLQDGTIWRSDRREIAGKLSELQLAVSEGNLDAEPPKEDAKKP